MPAIAKVARVGPRTVSSAIEQFERDGILAVERDRGGRVIRHQILVKTLQSVQGPEAPTMQTVQGDPANPAGSTLQTVQGDPAIHDIPPLMTRHRHVRMQKPSLAEVTAYCNQHKFSINPQRFIDHYDSNGWRVGRNPMRDWKAAVRTWVNREEENHDKRKNRADNSKTITSQPSTEHSRWIAKEITGLAGIYREPMTEERLKAYVKYLEDIDPRQLSRAFEQAISELDYFPKIAQLRKLAGADKAKQDDAAARAGWEEVRRFLKKCVWSNANGGPVVEHPERLEQKLHDCVKRSGGWLTYLQMTREDFPFVQKRFFEEFRAWHEVNEALRKFEPKSLLDGGISPTKTLGQCINSAHAGARRRTPTLAGWR